ncbi:MAG: tRNA (guanosine(46)-N7)-methyltransferase TrmB [Ruminococcus sp.]|jgi:tRNA (guanine-N7-)-methyltransferase|nr:tRNA (guanosine(46)-N7)-methyltransferase TrmB [Ruminococcus sp.]
MRIRCKPWARPELEACPFFIPEPAANRGHWDTVFGNGKPIYLELGCGKGGFASQAVLHWTDVNFIAVDIKNEMLVLAKRKIEQALESAGRSHEQVRVMIYNISNICNAFGEEDEIDRIFINFCNPWPKSKHKKRRLTHTRQLMQYRAFLRGELWFKTDDDELFEESLEYFADAGYEIRYLTRDLHNSGFADNLVTEHEQMFTQEGKNIKFLIAVPCAAPKERKETDGEYCESAGNQNQ